MVLEMLTTVPLEGTSPVTLGPVRSSETPLTSTLSMRQNSFPALLLHKNLMAKTGLSDELLAMLWWKRV